LSGTLPLGAFVLLHLWNNFHALQGQEAYRNAVHIARSSPFVVALEVVGLYVPLAFHSAYGLALILKRRTALGDAPSETRAALTADRASSLVAFAFIAYHLAMFRIPVLLGTMREADFFPALCDQLSSTTYLGVPLAASIYLVGLGATSYHFAHGLTGFCSTWGIPLTERTKKVAVGASVILGVASFLLGVSAVLYFATGSPLPGRV